VNNPGAKTYRFQHHGISKHQHKLMDATPLEVQNAAITINMTLFTLITPHGETYL
jgi:hypothetical protein